MPSTTKSTTSNNKKLPTPALVSETTTIPKEIIASKSSIPRIPRVEDISSFFDKQRESMETTGSFRSGFGLGFRGTIPKLPAFKKKPGSERWTANYLFYKGNQRMRWFNFEFSRKLTFLRTQSFKIFKLFPHFMYWFWKISWETIQGRLLFL